MKALSLAFSFFILAGCATPVSTPATISVSAFAKPNAAELKKFFIVKGTNIRNQLEFEEIRSVLESHLKQAGFVSAAALEADLAIYLDYGDNSLVMPFPRSVPVYGQTGGGISTINSTTTGSGGLATTTGTITTTPRFGVTGYRTANDTMMISTIMIRIQGFPAQFFRTIAALPEDQWKNHELPILWDIDARYAAEGTIDRRIVIPKMINAVSQYIAKSSGQTLEIKLPE